MEPGNGIYWTSKKGGPGKSTLVKYLCKNDRTCKALKKWAGKEDLVIAK
jgi:hypothetical protein